MNAGALDSGYREAMAVFGRGDYAAAAAGFRALLEHAPRSAAIWAALGAAQQRQGRYGQARESYVKAIALDPDQVDAHCNLGTLLAALRRIGDAEACFRAALCVEPRHLPALAGLGAALDRQGRYPEGLALLEPVVAGGVEDPEIVLSLTALLLHSGRYEEGVRTLERVLASRSGDFPIRQRLHFRLADLFDRLGRYDDAFDHYRQGNELKGAHFDAAAYRAEVGGILETFTRDVLAGLPRAAAREPAPIFIVGMPRSGTSLVEQVLAAHPGVHAAGELELVPRVAAHLGAGGPWPQAARALTPGALNALAAEFRRMAEFPEGNVQRVTDKTLGNFGFLALIEMLFPNARIIHCRRSPLDTCLSCYFQNFGGRALPFSYDLGNLGLYYRQYERLMSHWRESSGLPMLEVVYEDVVGSPERACRAIIGFAGLDWHDGCLEFHAIDRPVETVSHAQVRMPVYATSVGRHRHYERHLGALRRALDPQSPGGRQ